MPPDNKRVIPASPADWSTRGHGAVSLAEVLDDRSSPRGLESPRSSSSLARLPCTTSASLSLSLSCLTVLVAAALVRTGSVYRRVICKSSSVERENVQVRQVARKPPGILVLLFLPSCCSFSSFVSFSLIFYFLPSFLPSRRPPSFPFSCPAVWRRVLPSFRRASRPTLFTSSSASMILSISRLQESTVPTRGRRK